MSARIVQDELHSNLDSAEAIVTESLNIGREETSFSAASESDPQIRCGSSNIDVAACEARGVKVLGVRRRANIACAEHAFALMLALASG